MAAESDTAGAGSFNGRYRTATATAAAAAASISLSARRSPLDIQPFNLPPTPPLVTTLPPAIDCSYIGEGSANAVFCVTPKPDAKATKTTRSKTNTQSGIHPSNDSDAGSLSTHLLRIPKAGPGVGSSICLDHHAYYTSVLRPLIGAEWLVGQQLVQGIISRGIQPTLNGLLEDLDRSGARRSDWIGTRISADVDVALLVEDMTLACNTSLHPSTTTTIQFKPKWLVQSPNAPAGARRCRTCALSAASLSASPSTSTSGKNSNGSKKGRSGSVHHKIKPCPMVLVADPPRTTADEADLDAALWDYVHQHLSSAACSQSSSPNSSSPLTNTVSILKNKLAIIRWLRKENLFRRMAAIQAEYDPHGALSVGLTDRADDVTSLDRLQTAMTLRDCTCFLRVTVSDSGAGVTISAKLGDLDRKDGRRKLARWQAQERKLLDGGFYLCTEEPRQQTNCWLERRRV